VTKSKSVLDLFLKVLVNLVPAIQYIKVGVEVQTFDHVLNVLDLQRCHASPVL
jgi:hypothetical protein